MRKYIFPIVLSVFLIGVAASLAAGFKDSADDLQERAFYLQKQSEAIYEEGKTTNCDAMKILYKACGGKDGYDCERYDDAVVRYERNYGEGSRTTCIEEAGPTPTEEATDPRYRDDGVFQGE